MFKLDYSELFKEEDLKEITDLIKSGYVCGWWSHPDGGEHLRRFEARMRNYTETKYVKAVSSGTASILLALRAMGVHRNDIVITAGYNHIGGLAPITQIGAIPFFTDVDGYGNISYESFISAVESLKHRHIFSNTRPGAAAVVITHSLGQPCMDTKKIVKYAHDHNIAVIEDCSQALGASINLHPVGCFGDVACFSVGGDMTKMITTGEGGIIATDIGYVADGIDNMRNHGDKEGAQYPCFNFRMSDLQALIGFITLKTLDMQLVRTKVNADYLIESLKKIWVTIDPPKHTTPSNYILKFHAEGPLADPRIAVEIVAEKFGASQPRMAVSQGYRTALTDLEICRSFPRTITPMINRIIETSLWVDWHRWPHTRETIDPLIATLEDVF